MRNMTFAAVLIVAAALLGCRKDPPEQLYGDILSMASEVKSASALPAGTERTHGMTRFIKRDYPGLLYERTAEFLKLRPPSDKRYEAVKTLHDAIGRSLDDRPRAHSPMPGKLDPKAFVSRLAAMAALVDALKAIELPE